MKNKLRTHFLKRRNGLSRPLDINVLTPSLKGCSPVLSYASFSSELCTKDLNKYLLNKKRLALPKINGNTLEIFHITDPSLQLKANRWGIMEPIPEMCTPLDTVSTVIIPGVAFDSRRNRLGYGKGFYDRFLASLPKETLTIGIAYKEQKAEELLPTVSHDIAVQLVFYF